MPVTRCAPCRFTRNYLWHNNHTRGLNGEQIWINSLTSQHVRSRARTSSYLADEHQSAAWDTASDLPAVRKPYVAEQTRTSTQVVNIVILTRWLSSKIEISITRYHQLSRWSGLDNRRETFPGLFAYISMYKTQIMCIVKWSKICILVYGFPNGLWLIIYFSCVMFNGMNSPCVNHVGVANPPTSEISKS